MEDIEILPQSAFALIVNKEKLNIFFNILFFLKSQDLIHAQKSKLLDYYKI